MTGSLDAKVESGRARVTLSDDSGITLNLDLDREKLLSLIRAFGAVHAEMVKQDGAPPLAGGEVRMSHGAEWWTQAVESGSVLAFSHQEFGPVGLFLPPDEVEQLGRLILAQVDLRQRPSERGH